MSNLSLYNRRAKTRSTFPRILFVFLLLVAIWPGSAILISRESGKLTAVSDREAFLPAASFRMTFGLKDASPQAWDGYLLPAPGQVLRIEADHFRAHSYREVGFSARGRETKTGGEATLPNDFVRSPTSWVCSTRQASMHGPTTEWHVRAEKPEPVIESPSILVHQNQTTGHPIRIKTAQGEFSFTKDQINPFQPSLFLDGSVRVDYIPPTSPVAPKQMGQQDFPSILGTKSGEFWVAWQEYDGISDSVYVRKKVGNNWEPVSVLLQDSDVFHTALGKDGRGHLWVIWSMQVDGNWDLYGRTHDGKGWSQVARLTDHSGSDAYHKVVTDSKGRLWLVWQKTVNGRSQIAAKHFDGKRWSQENRISEGISTNGNSWWPSVAAGKNGSIVVAWDGYASGSYDVYLRRFENNRWRPVQGVATTSRFEAHPTIAFDHEDRVWVAWGESGADWGKDTGFLVMRKGTQLHESRTIRIVCVDGNRTMSTAGQLTQVLTPGEFWELPHLQIDSSGSPWLFVRRMTMRQPDTPLEGPIDLALWEIYATRYDGSRWRELMYLPRSSGRNDMIPTTTIDSSGNLWATWATDKRSTRSFLPHQLQVQVASLGNLNLAEPLELTPFTAEPLLIKPFPSQELEQVKRIGAFRIESCGKSYSIFRGDMHRHTDISIDGHNDGSLLDAYRYARDVAALDFLGIADHTNDAQDLYAWWRSQKVADLFQIKGSFVAFYGYERSVEYPNGHRNIFFVKRGVPILPISQGETLAWEGAERLFWYLRRNNGFSIPHTTGRTSGTDWRDNDPKVENLVEIYQGMRDTYEYPGAPRPKRLWTQFLDPSKRIPRASSSEASSSFRRSGFVWNALAKGYKLGFIASSDHISTHISYAFLIAEKLTPESLLEAVRARRAYAGTDNIILDVRFIGSEGEHLMGEEFVSTTPVRIKAKIYGTDVLQQVNVIKNNELVHTIQANQSSLEFEFVDPKMMPGESYYYVRVIQKNGEMAWGSPAWVTHTGPGFKGIGPGFP